MSRPVRYVAPSGDDSHDGTTWSQAKRSPEAAFASLASPSRVLLLERACAALAALVRQEYPAHLSLADIAGIWGDGISVEQVAALRALESDLTQPEER